MIYVIYYCLLQDGRAPSKISLDNYKLVGTVKAKSLSEAQRKWREKNFIRCIASHRPLELGDVIRDNSKVFSILTGSRWATVALLPGVESDLL